MYCNIAWINALRQRRFIRTSPSGHFMVAAKVAIIAIDTWTTIRFFECRNDPFVGHNQPYAMSQPET
jgi:hypothetical protein